MKMNLVLWLVRWKIKGKRIAKPRYNGVVAPKGHNVFPKSTWSKEGV